MALTESQGSQPGGCSFKDYSRKLLSVQVFGSFLYPATMCLKKHNRSMMTFSPEKHTLNHWMKALLGANSATILTSNGCLAVYFRYIFIHLSFEAFTKTNHVQNYAELTVT